MLDYLLVRPKDAELWKNNLPDTLKYIAVDELHTFDGAQGTDLACLLRRLKARLNVLPGQICCIGTSATMGAKDSAKSIREYASDRLLRSLAGDEHRNDIFIVGDSHQRIYRNKAVLSKCGINVRGRSSYLRINYRTTEEIRKFAFGLLNGVSFDDLDDDYDNGKGCQSLTHGDKPEIKEFATPEEELDYLVSRIHELETAGIEQKNICIVARTHKLLDSYIAGLQRAGIKSFEIKANKTDDRTSEGVRIATMHRVKGLEFDYVFAVAVNKKVLPFGTRADFEDDISLEEFRTGEKCLLYLIDMEGDLYRLHDTLRNNGTNFETVVK